MKYGKEFYEKLLKDFLEEMCIASNLSDAGYEKLYAGPDPNFLDLYYDIERWVEPGNESWEEWRKENLAESAIRLENEFDFFTERIYQKHFCTPGTLCGALARLIAQATEILPFRFKVGFSNMFYWSPDDSETSETVSVDIFFIRDPS